MVFQLRENDLGEFVLELGDWEHGVFHVWERKIFDTREEALGFAFGLSVKKMKELLR